MKLAECLANAVGIVILLFLVQTASNTVSFDKHKIQIEAHSRDYKAGPVNGLYVVSTHEQLLLTLEDPGQGNIWQWAMISSERSGGIPCEVSKVYQRGDSAGVICEKGGGVYYAIAKLVPIYSITGEKKDILNDHFASGESGCFIDRPCLDVFRMQLDGDANDIAPTLSKTRLKNVVSDPIKVFDTQYCFIWAYKIVETDRVGYVSTEAEPMDSDGSYVKFRVWMWITEANAMSETELDHDLPQTEYAGVLTRRFKTKGLEPCIRYAHQAIELEKAVPNYVYDPDGEGVFWTMDIKAHTTSVISTLSDLSLTIASRQHIALYGCFVAETRVLLDIRQFSFLKAQRNDITKINIANSYMPAVLRQFMTTKLRHVHGHYVRFIGRPWEYEEASLRRDMQVFHNPCMTLEFGFAVRGVAYIAQNWLSRGNDDVVQISLPSLSDDDINLTNKNQNASSEIYSRYFKAYDFVFTTMHLVILTADSHIFLHPTSITYKGFGLIRETQTYRPGALVSRRWCANTGTPKEHNMIVPAFSSNGNFIIIQVVPGEETSTMWVQPPSESCLQPRRSKVSGKKKVKQGKPQTEVDDRLEYCIHFVEVPKVHTTLEEENVEEEEERKEQCKEIVMEVEKVIDTPEEVQKAKDALMAFWMSGQTLLNERDPHFLGEDDDPMSATLDETSTNYNSHVLYELDRRGDRLAQTLTESGIDVVRIPMAVGNKKLLWLHDVQFTAIERRFSVAVEFKSKVTGATDFSMAMIDAVVLDQPVRVSRKEDKEVLETDFIFSGVLLVRPGGDKGEESKRLDGNIKTFTMNTALSSFIIHLDYQKEGKSEDILIHATMDGTHARPLSYHDPSTKKKNEKAKVRFQSKHAIMKDKPCKPDVTVTEHGLISILLRKANLTDVKGQEIRDEYPQAMIIGFTADSEPLRKVWPFKGSSYVFQRLTADGQIVYGEYSLEVWKGRNDSKTNNGTGDFQPRTIDIASTTFLATPFESLFRGSVEASQEKSLDETLTAASQQAGAGVPNICPFSDFTVHSQRFDFAEVEYHNRITAELMYLGSTIPLEADILVEFDDRHGISVNIYSAIEESRDQTLVRKTIDINTFLTPANLQKMYSYSEKHEDGEELKEEIVIFSITLRPSIVNSQCPNEQLFKTITLNVGCNPFTSMRFIPEAVGLKKIPFLRSSDYVDRENSWTVTKEGEEYDVTLPRRKISFAQRHLFNCKSETSDKRGYCAIPRHLTKLFKENIYSIHFTKSVVPKFEQRLTRHVRRVTGNVFLYDILGGEINTNTSLLDSKCHNLAPSCAPNDESCGAALNASEQVRLQERPWTTNFLEQMNQLHHHTDVYRHYRDCFSVWRTTGDNEKVKMYRGLPSIMSSEMYWIFNSTNYNAFSFSKHRNMIFLIRAVVLNTPDNGYTYCQRLETFFLLQMTGVAPARQPLPWHFYLALITFVLFIFVLIYFYFARSSRWQAEVSARRIREEEEKEQREADAKAFAENQDPNADAFGKWAVNLRTLARDRERRKAVNSGAPFKNPEKRADINVDNSGDKPGQTAAVSQPRQ